MKKLVLLPILLIMLVIPGCGAEGDPIFPVYSDDILPGVPDATIGSEDLPYAEGHFITLYPAYIDEANILGDAKVDGTLGVSGHSAFEEATFNGQISLEGDGQVWLEFRVDLDFESVRAHGVPTWVTRGVFGGFSLPVGGADEELQFECCVPDRWYGPAWEELGDVGDEPGGMAVSGGLLFIPCEGDDTVWTYDGTTLSNSGTVGDGPVYAVTHNNIVYVSCAGDDTVWQYSGGAWSKSGDVGNTPHGMVSDGNDLYVACRTGDEIWRLSGGVWAVDPALGAGGVAGAVGDSPEYMAYYGGDVYAGCAGVDDDVWIRTGGAWAKDADVDNGPAEFHEHDGDLYLNCEDDDTVWSRVGGVWAVVTNVTATIGNAPIGLEEYHNYLYSACMGSVWSNKKDFWNVNSDFSIVTADEPMFLKVYDNKLYCSCYDSDSIWVFRGETASVNIYVWLTDAQGAATDAFRLEIEYATFTPDIDTVPVASEAWVKEKITGVAAQFQTYLLHFPIDMTGVAGDDGLGFRITRIASSDEIVGEVVIQHVGVLFKCDKIGSATSGG